MDAWLYYGAEVLVGVLAFVIGYWCGYGDREREEFLVERQKDS